MYKMSSHRSVLLGIAVGASAGVAIGTAAVCLACRNIPKCLSHQSAYLAHCTCRQQLSSCVRHNQELLYEISQVTSNLELMWGLGINLGINFQAIQDIYVEYKDSINTAAFIMLLKWYVEKKELNVPDLKCALSELQLERFNEEMIDRHFEHRMQFRLQP